MTPESRRDLSFMSSSAAEPEVGIAEATALALFCLEESSRPSLHL